MLRPYAGIRAVTDGESWIGAAVSFVLAGELAALRIRIYTIHSGAMEKPKCPKCGVELVAKPVPGAKQFPQRLECPEHGWQQEELRPIRMRFHKDRPNW